MINISVQGNAWSEVALISIASATGSEVQFAGLTEDIGLNRGEHGVDVIAVLNGGRIVKKNPEAETEITIDNCYPVDINSSGGGGMAQMFNGTFDSSQPLQSTNTRVRNLYRISVMWTDDSTCTTATGAVVSGANGLRFSAKNAYMTKCVGDFKDKVYKESYTFICPPYNVSGTGNITIESVDGTAALSALSAYTS